MVNKRDYSMEGGCTCGAVRYRMTSEPMFVNCCHCRWCQRETGASFALNAINAINAIIEADRVVLLSGSPEAVHTPSESRKGQKIARCPHCHIALWSNCAGAGDALHFVRVGTLDEPDRLSPDVHIYTRSKQPWVILPPGTPAFEEYYNRKELWPEESVGAARIIRFMPVKRQVQLSPVRDDVFSRYSTILSLTLFVVIPAGAA